MSDLLAEVDEVMRQERIERFFKEHGKWVIALIVGIVLITASVSGFKAWNRAANAAGTDALLTLLDAPEFPENMLTAELDMRGGLRGIGLITAAGAFLDEGKTEESFQLYSRAASDKSIPDDLQSLAVLMAVRLNSKNPADMQKKLMKIWKDKNSPWQYHARLEAASLYAKNEDYEKALEQLSVIQDTEGLPKTLYDTARALNHVYTLKHQASKE